MHNDAKTSAAPRAPKTVGPVMKIVSWIAQTDRQFRRTQDHLRHHRHFF